MFLPSLGGRRSLIAFGEPRCYCSGFIALLMFPAIRVPPPIIRNGGTCSQFVRHLILSSISSLQSGNVDGEEEKTKRSFVRAIVVALQQKDRRSILPPYCGGCGTANITH
jgi:hypothetical protein